MALTLEKGCKKIIWFIINKESLKMDLICLNHKLSPDILSTEKSLYGSTNQIFKKYLQTNGFYADLCKFFCILPKICYFVY